MSASLALSHDIAANPLDIMEQIIAANEWAFDRRSESAVEFPGFAALQPVGIPTLSFNCVSAKRRTFPRGSTLFALVRTTCNGLS